MSLSGSLSMMSGRHTPRQRQIEIAGNKIGKTENQQQFINGVDVVD